LEKALGIKSQKELNHQSEFMDLFGVWSEEDYKEFTESVKDFEIVDLRVFIDLGSILFLKVLILIPKWMF